MELLFQEGDDDYEAEEGGEEEEEDDDAVDEEAGKSYICWKFWLLPSLGG